MKIVNFGSVNIDYVYTVPHFVRPGETLAAVRRDIFPGGKGLNQTTALSRALGKASGIEICIAGGIGKNDGAILKQAIIDMNVDTALLGEYDAPSGHTFIQVDASGQNSIVYYAGTNKMQTKDFIDGVLAHFSKGDFIILQNEINMLDYIIEKAHERGLVIFFNPSPFEKSILDLPLHYVDCFLVNEVEAADIAGVPVGNGDELLLIRLINNLLSNALKFTRSSVALELCVSADACKLSISDDGEGIEPALQNKIWDKLYQIERSRNREQNSGAGLGLAIASQIAKIHGAQISLRSKVGRGSKFSVEFKKV